MPYRSPYPQEVRQQAVHLVVELRPRFETERAAIKMVADSLDIRSAETVRKWVRQAEIAPGNRPGAAEDKGQSGYEALAPLNNDILKQRISDLFPNGYLALIAIVQGVALAVLLEEVNQEVFTGQQSLLHRLTAASQAFGVFTAIVIITHRYFLLTAVNRWRPSPIDTLLPYALGASEAAMALMIGNNAGWWLALSVLFLVAMASFTHTLIRENEALYGDLHRLYVANRRAIKLQLINCSVLMPVSMCFGLLSIYSTLLPPLFHALAPWAIIAAVSVIEIHGERNRSKIYATYGFPGWRGKIRT
jgi:transposase-like protein